jgi:hypothetical protein
MSWEGDFDYQQEAEAAMKLAAATNGFERLDWVRVALWWQTFDRAIGRNLSAILANVLRDEPRRFEVRRR